MKIQPGDYIKFSSTSQVLPSRIKDPFQVISEKKLPSGNSIYQLQNADGINITYSPLEDKIDSNFLPNNYQIEKLKNYK